MQSILDNKRIALVYDWLTNISGTDRVLKAIHDIFPQAPIYALFGNQDYIDEFLPNADVHLSHLQKTFMWLNRPSFMLPFIPSAIESFDLSDYDIVISIGASYSKGVIVSPQTLHINYCHSPTRQLWDWTHQHSKEHRWFKRPMHTLGQHMTRLWDLPASRRADYYIANSQYIQRRISKYYNRDSQLIYPPAASHKISMASYRQDTQYEIPNTKYFLIVGRQHKHKNIDIAVRAFNKLGWPLVIIGDGPEQSYLKSIADHNVSIIGYQDENAVSHYFQNAQAFIMPQEEDFGIVPIEAMSYGKPVIALRRGGALEYIKEGITGEFFDDPHEGALANAVRITKEKLHDYDPDVIRQSVAQFDNPRFTKQIRQFILEKTYEYFDKSGDELPG